MSSSILQDTTFWAVGIGGIFVAVVTISIKYLYKIKCNDCNFLFGCVHCTRNIELEVQDHVPGQIEEGGVSTREISLINEPRHRNRE